MKRREFPFNGCNFLLASTIYAFPALSFSAGGKAKARSDGESETRPKRPVVRPTVLLFWTRCLGSRSAGRVATCQRGREVPAFPPSEPNCFLAVSAKVESARALMGYMVLFAHRSSPLEPTIGVEWKPLKNRGVMSFGLKPTWV